MPSPEEYRQKAEACVALAEVTRSTEERASLLIIAQTYLKLASMAFNRHQLGTAHRDLGEAAARPESDG